MLVRFGSDDFKPEPESDNVLACIRIPTNLFANSSSHTRLEQWRTNSNWTLTRWPDSLSPRRPPTMMNPLSAPTLSPLSRNSSPSSSVSPTRKKGPRFLSCPRIGIWASSGTLQKQRKPCPRKFSLSAVASTLALPALLALLSMFISRFVFAPLIL